MLRNAGILLLIIMIGLCGCNPTPTRFIEPIGQPLPATLPTFGNSDWTLEQQIAVRDGTPVWLATITPLGAAQVSKVMLYATVIPIAGEAPLTTEQRDQLRQSLIAITQGPALLAQPYNADAPSPLQIEQALPIVNSSSEVIVYAFRIESTTQTAGTGTYFALHEGRLYDLSSRGE